jgi:PTH1 family peptidyl-tRNA hydrolase
VVERLAERLGVRKFATKYAGHFADVSTPRGPVGLLIPTTYMNLSGDSAGPAAGALHATRPQVLVVHDELDLPFGVVRGKVGGGAGGHNGLRSLTQALGGPDYLRVRLGVGRPPPVFRGDQADWVLMGFNEPAAQVNAMIDAGVRMVEAILDDGMESAIGRFHASEPGSRARERRLRKDAERQNPAQTAPQTDVDTADGAGEAT